MVFASELLGAKLSLDPKYLKDHAKFSLNLHMDATSWLKKNLINEGSSSTKYALHDLIELLQKGSSCGNHCFCNIMTTQNAKSHCGSTPQ